MAKPKSFYSWMIHTHTTSPGMIGKLARDMGSDGPRFTRGWSRRRNEAYLNMVDASAGILDAFETAWAEYEQYKAGFTNA